MRFNNTSFFGKYLTAEFLTIIFFIMLVSLTTPAYSITNFSGIINLTNDLEDSADPQIAVSGNDVYVVWTNGTENSDIFFKHSPDGGLNFEGKINLSSNGSASSHPQIAVAENKVFVVWQDDPDGFDVNDAEILFRKSSDKGQSFDSIIELSNDSFESLFPQITTTFNGTNIHVTWLSIDPLLDTDIFYLNSNNSGSSFGVVKDLSDNLTTSFSSNFAASGNNVYVTWVDDIDSDGTNDILYKKSANNGTSFESTENLSNSPLFTSENPQISAIDNNVYVTWQDNSPDLNDFDIFLQKSEDNGSSFNGGSPIGIPINLSSNDFDSRNAKITTNSDGNVYVIWEDYSNGNSDIFFRASTDNGINFNPVKNLSNDANESQLPEIAGSGHRVYVTWQDFVSGVGDIFFKSSVNNGTSFGGFQNLSNDSVFSFNQKISPTNSDGVILVWQNDVLPSDIFLSSGISSLNDISFDKIEYILQDVATITVTNTPGLGQVNVEIVSTSDQAGFTHTLTEIGNTGTYVGTITFTTGSSNSVIGALKIDAGDIITSSFESQSSSANIKSRSLQFSFNDYSLNSRAKIIVNDNTANLDPNLIDSVTVHVTSTTDAIDLTLYESGINTGIFDNDTLIFTTGDAKFTITDKPRVTLQVNDTSLITLGNPNTVTTQVFSDSDPLPGGISLILEETAPNSKIFSKLLEFTENNSVENKSIKVKNGDIVSVKFTLGINDEITNGLIIPSPDNVGALQAVYSTPIPDVITAAYHGIQSTVEIIPGGGGGGGGGGPVRPGLVLNAIAVFGGSTNSSPLQFGDQKSIFGNLFADSSKPISPSTDSSVTYPLTINGNGFAIQSDSNKIVTQNVNLNEPVIMSLVFYDTAGEGLEHVEVHLAENMDFSNSEDTQITYDKGETKIFDPKLILDKDDFTFKLVHNGTKFMLNYGFKFKQESDNINLLIKAWNPKRDQTSVRIFEAFEVNNQNEFFSLSNPDNKIQETIIKDQMNVKVEESETSEQIPIPSWIKRSAGEWNQAKISDLDFMQGIDFMIGEKLLKVSDMTKENQGRSPTIPSWVRTTSGWWYNDKISDLEFISALEYLIEHGIIRN